MKWEYERIIKGYKGREEGESGRWDSFAYCCLTVWISFHKRFPIRQVTIIPELEFSTKDNNLILLDENSKSKCRMSVEI